MTFEDLSDVHEDPFEWLSENPQPGSPNYDIQQAERDNRGHLRWLREDGTR